MSNTFYLQQPVPLLARARDGHAEAGRGEVGGAHARPQGADQERGPEARAQERRGIDTGTQEPRGMRGKWKGADLGAA